MRAFAGAGDRIGAGRHGCCPGAIEVGRHADPGAGRGPGRGQPRAGRSRRAGWLRPCLGAPTRTPTAILMSWHGTGTGGEGRRHPGVRPRQRRCRCQGEPSRLPRALHPWKFTRRDPTAEGRGAQPFAVGDPRTACPGAAERSGWRARKSLRGAFGLWLGVDGGCRSLSASPVPVTCCGRRGGWRRLHPAPKLACGWRPGDRASRRRRRLRCAEQPTTEHDRSPARRPLSCLFVAGCAGGTPVARRSS